MTNPSLDHADEKPLDPAILRVQARLRRLMLIAALTLGLGIATVLAAVVYRITRSDNSPPATAAGPAISAVLPAGARLVSSNLSGERIVLTYEHAGGTTVIVVNARTLVATGRLDLKPE